MESSSGKPRRAGIYDVAELAGVSRQTVTRAMNDMPDISPKTKQKVLDAAKHLRYRPSRYGRGLVTRGTPTLGLVVVDITNPYYAQLASSVLTAASGRGWNVLIVEWAEKRGSVLTELPAQVDAIAGHFDLDPSEIEELVDGAPLVLLDAAAGDGKWSGIDFDFVPGMQAAIDHLIAIGRHKIVMLDCTLVAGRQSRRADAFIEVTNQRGLIGHVMEIVVELEPDMNAGRKAVDCLVERFPGTDAVIAFNDIVAVGAMKQLQRYEKAVPGEIAVIGIDGLPIGEAVSPELTSLELDMASYGELVVELSAKLVENPAGTFVHRAASHTLRRRLSA